VRSIALIRIAVTFSLLSFWIPNDAIAGAEHHVCDAGADYFLGLEDYSEAIRLHFEMVRENPGDALAHYHLGFALGMVGDKKAEVREYQRAEALGLTSWDLFLNLGLAQFENGDLDAAADSLRRAVLLGEDHSESHFNLALVEERRGMLADAEHETLASLLLNPGQPDARNLLGVIYAQKGEAARASEIWRDLVHDVPGYVAARANLAILGNLNEVASGETAVVDLPRAAAVNAIPDYRGLPFPTGEVQLSPRHVQEDRR
jgi:Flp pilus assembly protein TadD